MGLLLSCPEFIALKPKYGSLNGIYKVVRPTLTRAQINTQHTLPSIEKMAAFSKYPVEGYFIMHEAI